MCFPTCDRRFWSPTAGQAAAGIETSTPSKPTTASPFGNTSPSTTSVSRRPGFSWQAVEDGVIEMGGTLPVNPSGGLLGLGHPVGATGVRMLLDGARQVTGRAGDYQVPGAKKVGLLNIGGSATTVASFVVGL